MGHPALIEVSQLAKSFAGKHGEHRVLDQIDMTVTDGEIVALLGKSGSGKSTLLRLIAGLAAPTSGEVRYRGRRVTGTNPGAVLVFQSFALLPWLTVQQNVELGLEARGVERAARAARALEAIDRIGLDGFESAYPKELSGGMKQRVGFARALVVEPDVLLMDEPFSALDVLTAENLRGELLEIWEERTAPREGALKAIVIVTHNIEEALLLADRVVVLGSDPGRIVDHVSVDLPRPRDRSAKAFESQLNHLYRVMTADRDKTEAGPIPVASGPDAPPSDTPVTAPLPDVTVDGLSGFVEILTESDGEAQDLADLASTLSLEVDDLLPLVDAAAMLRFVDVAGGKVSVTESGAEFARASIQQSKRVFAETVLEHAPLVRMIDSALVRSATGELGAGFFLDLVRSRMSDETAAQQLRIATDWGRYAELFDHDLRRGVLSLDAGRSFFAGDRDGDDERETSRR